jgi:hypothetical protein
VIAIAYLAPEIPSRSATFVYREARALEAAGCALSYFSVHRPHDPAPGEEAIAREVRILYRDPVAWRVLRSHGLLPAAAAGVAAAGATLPGRGSAWRALRRDLRDCRRDPLTLLKLTQQ